MRRFASILLLVIALFVNIDELHAQCIAVTNSNPYTESFESSDGNWVEGGSFSDWQWGQPVKSIIKNAAQGQKCWITGGLSGSTYNAGERSYIVSPCFNLSVLSDPYIEFDIFWEQEYRYDGASFQYSIDNGVTWLNLGAVNEPANCLNSNWFNYNNIFNMTGLGPSKEGWTGTVKPSSGSCSGGLGSGRWVKATHTLSNLAGQSNVKFRFTFCSGTTCNNYDGFAIDNIVIKNAPSTNADFNYTCISNRQVSFANLSTPCFNNFLWNFDDPASGASNTATSYNATHSFSGPGKYNVTLTATGSSGPSITIAKTIYIMDIAATITNVITCNNNKNGAANATLTAHPATQGITYNWNTTPVSNATSISGVGAGTYIVTVTANDACAASDTVVLINPQPITFNTVKSNATCGAVNGFISIKTNGGYRPYSYTWSPFVTTDSSAANLSPGTYKITVNDSAGCKDSVSIVLVNDGGVKVVISSKTDVKCFNGNDGSATSTVTGAGGPYSYQWIPYGGTTAVANNLAAGLFKVIVSDIYGCKDSASVQINQSLNGPVIRSFIVNDARCYGQSSASVSAVITNGALPYTYKWFNGTDSFFTAGLQNVRAGNYTLTIKDMDGCIAKRDTTVGQPANITINLSTKPATCGLNNGMAWADVTGGIAPYTYVWSNGETGDTVKNLSTATVSVQVKDVNGCTVLSGIEPVRVSNPLKISLGNDSVICPGSKVVLYPGKFSSYLWQDNSTDSIYIVSNTGKYEVQVTDNAGCKATASVNITVNCRDIVFPDGFTPNNDGRNDLFGPVGTLSSVSDYTFSIYNRYGQQIFRSTYPNNKWNGKINGVAADNGVYVWVAQYSFDRRPLKTVKGTVVLIR